MFDPFNKSPDDLNANDLLALKNVREGWYIEYKQEVPKSDSIAKSISAMANSYGGWVFYGIKEESKENSVAGEFPGVSISEADSSLQKIRQAVANALSPSCHFETFLLKGPCEEIGLTENKCIICVAIPQSIEAPHIHSKGVIYRRVADGSEPVAETDRYMIEKMFQRNEFLIKKFKDWIDDDFDLSDVESDAPFLRLLIAPNIWRAPRSQFKINIDTIMKTLNSHDGRRTGIPFDTIYSSTTGVIARQCTNNDPTSANLTWQFYEDLRSEVLIPLAWCRGDTNYIYNGLRKSKHVREFTDLLDATASKTITVVNLSMLHNLLAGIVESLRAILKEAQWPQSFYIKAKITNISRTIPFFDSNFFIEHLRKNGIPVSLTKSSIAPSGKHPESFDFIDSNTDTEDEHVQAMIQATRCFIPISEAFGLPFRHMLNESIKNKSSNEHNALFEQLIETGIRTSSQK